MAFKKGHLYGKRFKKGQTPWNKNLTKETDERVKKYGEKGSKTIKRLLKEGDLIPSRLGKYNSKESKEKSRHSHLGNKLSKESIIKREESRRENGWFRNLKETRRKMRIKRAKQKTNFTSSQEIKIQNFLKKLGIEFFTHQYLKQIKHAYQCDILIPSMNLIIECDGDFMHCNPTNYPSNFVRYPNSKNNQPAYVIWERDRIRTKELIEKGFKVLRLWEFEINEMSISEFKKTLNKQTS